MRVNLAQVPCKYFNSLTCCSSSSKKICTYHPCTKGHAQFLCAKTKQRATDSIICCRLFRGIRTFGRAVEGSSDSPLTITMGGLSGGGRGGDTSGLCSAPSLIISQLRVRAFALDLGCGTCCPPFVIWKAYTIEGSSIPRRKSSAMR